VQLKDITSKFIMSPPAKKAPRVSLRGKYVRVEFQDSLRSETTYSLDFGDAIADNNEGNPLGFYRYVFSTGEVVDTMELSGQVIDARTRLPLLGMNVMLYANLADSAAVVELPSYVARTDSSGRFRVTNIRERPYRVMVVEDMNRDNMFTPEEERVGFVDSLVTPVVWHEWRMDTLRPDTTRVLVKRSRKGAGVEVEVLTKDTVVEREYVLFGPSNLHLVMFEEEKTQLYMTGEERKGRERLDFTFSVPAENHLKARLLDVETDEDWYLVERSAGHDTLTLWIRDSLVFKRDSLRVELNYSRSDSLRRLESHRDTTLFVFTEKKPTETRRRGRQEEADTTAVAEMKFLDVKVGIGSPHDLNKPVVLEFDKPLTTGDLPVSLLMGVDSTWQAVPCRWQQDSLKIRRFTGSVPWKPETEYRLVVDSMAIHDIGGLFNRPIDTKFKTRALDTYGQIFVNATGVTCPVIFQLCQGDREVKVVEERFATANGRVTFNYLREGKYTLRVIIDTNGNGKWDTGNFLRRLQPEEIKYFPEEFNVKQNFDIEQDVAVDRDYPREDPAKRKKSETSTPGRR
jgi:hypothetical protein